MTIDNQDLESMDLAELFAESDRVGNKYLTDEEVTTQQQEWARLRNDLLVNFNFYAARTRHERS